MLEPPGTHLALRQTDQGCIDFADVESDLEFLMQRINRLPTACGLWRATLLIAFVSAVFGIVGIEACWRYFRMLFLTLIGIAAVLVAADNPALAKEHRSREVAREFQWQHPCPSTGRATGACPGYVRDHIVPLACGGPDAVQNMQWQTVGEARAKDRWETKGCNR